MNNTFGLSWSKFITKYRLTTIFISLSLATLLASGGQFLSFTSDYRVFFGSNDAHLQAFEELQNTYTKNDNVLIVLSPEDGTIFTQKMLEAIADITEKAWQTPYSIRVDSITNFQHTSAQGDDLQVMALFEDNPVLTDIQIRELKNIVLSEPILRNRLISNDAKVTAINITIELPGINEATENPTVVASIRDLRKYIEANYKGIKVYLSGIVMMNQAFNEASTNDTTKLIPLATLVILIMVFLQLRGLTGTLCTFLVILLSVASAMGAAGWLGIKLTAPSMSAPTIILTLAVADCVHVLSNWVQKKNNEHLDNISAMNESIKINFHPVFLTSITTAIGFLSLNFSDSPPFHDLGNISAMGVMFAWFFSMTLLPALSTLLPSRTRSDRSRIAGLMSYISNFVIDKHRIIIPISVLAIVGLTVMIPKNALNDVFVHYFDDRIEFRPHTDFVVDNLTGIYFIDYSLDSGESGGIANPKYLEQVEKFTKWLENQPEVIHVNSITNIFKRINKSMHGDSEDWYKLPTERNMAAQYLLLYEMSLPYGLDLNNQIDIDKQKSRLSVTLETLSTTETLEFEQRSYSWMRNNTPSLLTTAASPPIMFSHISMRNIISMLLGTSFALLAISLIMIVSLKSWRFGLLTLVPNIIPAAMAFGIWALIDGEVGLGLSVVAAMTLGIIVDDTIHFMSKYLHARRQQNLDSISAIKYSFSTVGVALWTTTMSIAAGFLVLSTSAFSVNAEMGLLVTVVVILALVVDFLLLPALLIRFDKWLMKPKSLSVY